MMDKVSRGFHFRQGAVPGPVIQGFGAEQHHS